MFFKSNGEKTHHQPQYQMRRQHIHEQDPLQLLTLRPPVVCPLPTKNHLTLTISCSMRKDVIHENTTGGWVGECGHVLLCFDSHVFLEQTFKDQSFSFLQNK